MIEYIYKAKDKNSGEKVQGKISAESQMAAAKLLSEKDLFPISITTQKSQSSIFGFSLTGNIKPKSRVIFTRQLATLIKAGLPINQALHTAIDQVDEKSFRTILERIAAAVEGGQTLAASFAAYPKVFNTVYVSLVHAGEESGTLEETLQRLADQQEKEQQITSKVRGALIYPALVLVVIVAVLIYMLITVMPQIQSLYTEIDKPLPFLTQITIGFSQFITRYWYLVVLLVVATIFGVRAYVRSSNGRRVWDRAKMRMPILGPIFKKIYMARFARTLGSLVTSGVPLLEALDISANAINNTILKSIVLKASDEVKNGKALSQSLSHNDYFLKLVPQMIKIGEESGTLGDMCDKVATFYEDEVDQTLKNLSTIIEPVLMIVLGGMVFFIIIAILYPIYNLVGGGINLSPASGSGTGL